MKMEFNSKGQLKSFQIYPTVLIALIGAVTGLVEFFIN